MFSGPTRITESSSSHLDVFLTGTSCSFSNVAGFPCSFSDHHLVLGDYFGRRSHALLCDHKVIYTRCYQKLDAAVLEDLLADGVWNDVLSFDNVDDSVECFTTVLQGLSDALLPLRRIRIKQHTNPWAATSSVLAARRHRDKLYRRALLSGTPTDWQLFRHARNRVNHLLRSAKSQYLTDLCESSKGSSKQFWSLFRCLSTKSTKSNYNNDAFTADDINDYFLSVPFNTVQSVPSTSLSPLSYLLDRSEANFQMFTVDVDEVVSILTSLDSARATGCDELSVMNFL